MGASAWKYVEAYGGSIDESLGRLRQRVFEEQFTGDGHWAQYAPEGRPFVSVDELRPEWEDADGFLANEGGTHSVIDVWDLIAAEEDDDFHTVRPLTPRERRELFGTERPTESDYMQISSDPHHPGMWEMDRWSAWCTPLWNADGRAVLMAVWGRSGD